jgi:hypothetical protein
MRRLGNVSTLSGATVAAASLATWLVVAGASDRSVALTVPLCPSLTIVTGVNQQDGDYEPIKTIESVTVSDVRLKYSVERLVEDWLSAAPPKLQKYTLDRGAAAVKDALVKRLGIDASRLVTAGFGKSQPKDTNETLEGRARNRRVELVREL